MNLNYKKLFYTGITILLISVPVGIIGTLRGIAYSFVALDSAETVGIGEVSAGIEYALFFTIISIIGSISGLVLAVFGGIKLYRNKNVQDKE
jgi:uncharacterized Tic20 family protein